MATTIVGPGMGGAGGTGIDTIDQAFSKINSMFGNVGGGGSSFATSGVNPFGGYGFGSGGGQNVSPQPVTGDSLTQFWRGLSNLAGTTGAGLVGAGGNLLGSSMGVTQGGVDISGQGLNTMQGAIDFYNKLRSGDPATMTAVLGPTAANIAATTAFGTTMANESARGGQAATTAAQLPYAQAAQVGQAAEGLQMAGAQGLQQAGTEQAQIGQGIAQTGLGMGQLGTVLTGQGMQALQNTIADVLSKMGINIQGGTASLFSQVVGSL